MIKAWEGIDEFVAVVNAGNFSRAAKALGASTTHVSRVVMRLESRVQSQLLLRTTRTIRLTEAGAAFFEQCRKIIEERDEAISRISEHGDPAGELRVTCSTFMGERFVAPILRKFASIHPRVRISMLLTNRLIDLVAEGYDLAIRTGDLADSRLMGSRIGSRSLYTCASPRYVSERGRPTRVDELDSHDCIIGTSETWHFKLRGKALQFRPRGRWKVNSGTVALDTALEGQGICQLPDFYVLPHLQSGKLETLLDHQRVDDEPIWALHPQRRHIPAKVSRLVDLLRADLSTRLRQGIPEKD